MEAGRHACPIGTFIVMFSADILLGLDFDEDPRRLERLMRLHHGRVAAASALIPAAIGDRLDAYFEGQLATLADIPLCTGGTDFQRIVWAALCRIPPGQRETYGSLAVALGRPGASRAIGHANASNPISLVIPCHRLVGSNGSLTGYAGGIPRKAWLLAHERAHVFH